MTIKQIYLSEEVEEGRINYKSLHTDVIVKLTNGHTYKANFISIDELKVQLEVYQKHKKKVAKRYYWTNNMVIVDIDKRQYFKEIIEHMIEEGDFQQIFEKL